MLSLLPEFTSLTFCGVWDADPSWDFPHFSSRLTRGLGIRLCPKQHPIPGDLTFSFKRSVSLLPTRLCYFGFHLS